VKRINVIPVNNVQDHWQKQMMSVTVYNQVPKNSNNFQLYTKKKPFKIRKSENSGYMYRLWVISDIPSIVIKQMLTRVYHIALPEHFDDL